MKWVWLGLIIGVLAGCSTTREATLLWPEVSGFPEEPPASLELKTPATMLKKGDDGRLYVVGKLGSIKAGDTFYARYSGDWPLQDLPRPAFAFGDVVEVYNAQVALVQVVYALPESTLEGLEVSWGPVSSEEPLGKGLATFANNAGQITLDAGEGVQPGDTFMLLSRAPELLAKRVVGTCTVADGGAGSCVVHAFSPRHTALTIPESGLAVFLEHTYAKVPPEAEIRVATSGDKELETELIKTIGGYVSEIPRSNVRVTALEGDFDPARPDFHRIESQVPYEGRVTIVLAARREKDGIRVAYSGVGPASGPGMIAAPPEKGILVRDLKTMGDPLSGLVFSAVQVFRGRTSEALSNIRLMLNDSRLSGPMRWHLRDQFAMRFAGLGRNNDAILLVAQDMASAKSSNDTVAYLNALGTMVRLYDMVELPKHAVAASEEYLKARAAEKPSVAYQSALSMHVEMLLAANRIDEARKGIDELKSLCPDGCGGDLGSLLSSVFWAIPREERAMQKEVLADVEQIAEREKGSTEASFRIYQGLSLFGEGELEQALIAFLEAERIYAQKGYLQGVARASFMRMLVQMGRGEAEDAVDAGKSAIEIQRNLQDFGQVALIYERLSGLYANLDGSIPPGPWLGAGEHVMMGAMASASASNDLLKVAEASFNTGTFQVRVGQADESKSSFQRAAVYAIRVARFDLAAMSHLSLAMIARQEGDFETFRDEISRAQRMAAASKDPGIDAAIKRALMPPEEPEKSPTLSL